MKNKNKARNCERSEAIHFSYYGLPRRAFHTLLAMTLCIVFVSSSAFAAGEIQKKLDLKPHFSHLLSFNEKIIRYRTGEKAAFDVEILPDVMNSRNEMLVKPLKEVKTNIIIWTENHVYNFDVKVKDKDKETQFFTFNTKDKKGRIQQVGKKEHELKPISVGKYKVDLPPEPEERAEYPEELEIDLPPYPNK